MLDKSSALGLLSPAALLDQAPAAVLVETLPSDSVVAILDKAMTAGQMNADLVVEAASVATLGQHLPESALWAAISNAGQTAGLEAENPAKGDPAAFLRTAVHTGIEGAQLTPEHLLEHANPTVLMGHLPADLSAKVLQASLAAGAMTPSLIFETLGVDAFIEHLPANSLWACVCAVATAEPAEVEEAPAEMEDAPVDETPAETVDDAGDLLEATSGEADEVELEFDDDPEEENTLGVDPENLKATPRPVSRSGRSALKSRGRWPRAPK